MYLFFRFVRKNPIVNVALSCSFFSPHLISVRAHVKRRWLKHEAQAQRRRIKLACEMHRRKWSITQIFSKKEQIHRSIFFKRRVNFFWSGLKKKRDRKSRCFFRLTHKKSLCVCLFAQENKKQRKKMSKAWKKRGKKQLFVVFSHTEDCCTTDYHYHVSLPPRDRERERQRDREIFVVVVAKKKKKTTRGFERERSDARETKRTVSVWGNSI